jgi:hypothetical protein
LLWCNLSISEQLAMTPPPKSLNTASGHVRRCLSAFLFLVPICDGTTRDASNVVLPYIAEVCADGYGLQSEGSSLFETDRVRVLQPACARLRAVSVISTTCNFSRIMLPGDRTPLRTWPAPCLGSCSSQSLPLVRCCWSRQAAGFT